jgi:hypothetical protein
MDFHTAVEILYTFQRRLLPAASDEQEKVRTGREVLVLKEDEKEHGLKIRGRTTQLHHPKKGFKPASHTIITTAGNKDLRIPPSLNKKNRVNCNHKQYGCGLDIEATMITIWG